MTNNNSNRSQRIPRIICDLSSPDSPEPSYSFTSSTRSRTPSTVSTCSQASSFSSSSSSSSLSIPPLTTPPPQYQQLHNHPQQHQQQQHQQQHQQQNPQQSQEYYTYLCNNPPSIHPLFPKKVKHLSTRLCPLVSVTTGRPHPDFPSSLLSYHLLTSSQLDNLAHHFHQVHPSLPQTSQYPISIPPWIGTKHEHETDIATKRRRFGRFIGLKGCASPPPPSRNPNSSEDEKDREDEKEEERRLQERLDREWEAEMRRIREEEENWWKQGGGWYFP